MTSERNAGGHVAALLVEGRQSAGLNQSALADRAGVSRSRISAAESKISLPTIDVCIRLARALGVPVGTMVRAHVKDSVQEADPAALAELETELWGGASHWETIADHHGFRVERGRTLGTIDEDGDLKVTRQFAGCTATRPRKAVYFWNRVVGERAPDFAVKGTSKDLGYSVHVEVCGEWAVHRVEFVRPWTEKDGPFDFEFETTLPKAYGLDVDEYNRRRASEGLPSRRQPHGNFRSLVHHAFGSLELCVGLPRGFRAEWEEPTAVWGNAPIDADEEERAVHPRTCRAVKFEATEREARLFLERPVPGYTFGIRWAGQWAGGPGEEK